MAKRDFDVYTSVAVTWLGYLEARGSIIILIIVDIPMLMLMTNKNVLVIQS